MLITKVGELDEYLAKREEGSLTAKVSDITVDDMATEMTIKPGLLEAPKVFSLDQTANNAVSRFFKIPPKFYEDLTADFRATLLRYKMDIHKDVEVQLESLADNLVSLHPPTQAMLPLRRVGAVVTKVLDDDDSIRRISLADSRMHLDVTSKKHAVVFTNADEVGDITEGGMRVLTYPFQNRKPSVGAYLERLVCTNGMCTEERFGAIELKGRTVDEVIAAMEVAAEEVLSTLDDKLTDYQDTRNMFAPGTPEAFVAQLCREAKLGRKILDKILDIIHQLPQPVSIWDVNQAFTSVANEVEVYGTMTRLQSLGGHLAMNAEKMIERCKTCERLL